MKISKLIILILIVSAGICFAVNDSITKSVDSFESDWLFFKGQQENAKNVDFDASGWDKVSIPHDWSIQGPFNRDNPTGRGGAYLASGIGWYRKSFSLPKEASGMRVFVDFGGIMSNSDVWINGKHLGKRPYGYITFRYELTDYIKFGENEKNILAVRSDTSIQPASRWYTGAGIYRHAKLVVCEQVHLENWGVYITVPEVNKAEATVQIQTSVVNQSDSDKIFELVTKIDSPAGKTIKDSRVKKTIKPNDKLVIEQEFVVEKPTLWGIDSPELYKATTEIITDEKVTDKKVTAFGIREFEFKAESGFWLNGENLKIKGVCLHHDCGALGAAAPKAAWGRRLGRLKEVGVNGIRTAHNPFDPEFLELCDEMGFVVLHEILDTWTYAKNHAEKGYNLYFKEWAKTDTRDIVLRDRNHVCIVAYSAGNEIRDGLESEWAFETFKGFRDIYNELNPGRPVTQAVFRPNQYKVYDSGFSELMDVVGQNYRPKELVDAHLDKPSRKVLGTENGHSLASWLLMRDNAFYAGQFLWTGIDYLGEANWPNICWSEALFDRTCEPRPMAFQRKSWWADKPMVHIARLEKDAGGGGDYSGRGELCSNWTPRDLDTYDEAIVNVYSNCDEVELFLNGESQGIKEKPKDDSPRRWDMYFDAGTIKAVGMNGGKIVAEHELKTADEPTKISLVAENNVITNDWDDVVYVNVKILDENGIEHPWADKLINFEISGPGKILAVDNGNVQSHEAFNATQRRTYHGKCIAIIQATGDSGEITVKATSEELGSDEVKINVVPKN